MPGLPKTASKREHTVAGAGKYLEGYGRVQDSIPVEGLHLLHHIVHQEAQIQHRTCKHLSCVGDGRRGRGARGTYSSMTSQEATVGA